VKKSIGPGENKLSPFDYRRLQAETFAVGTAQDMNVGTAAGVRKEAGNENFTVLQNHAADRAYPHPVSVKAVNAAPDMHETVFAAVQGRKGGRAHQFAFVKPGAANRTGLGISGQTFAFGFQIPAFPERRSPGGYAYAEKEGIAEPEQNDPYYNKNQNLKNLFHALRLPCRPFRLIIY
jgi:hypothetical protein